jgi:hypothetical protein
LSRDEVVTSAEWDRLSKAFDAAGQWFPTLHVRTVVRCLVGGAQFSRFRTNRNVAQTAQMFKNRTCHPPIFKRGFALMRYDLARVTIGREIILAQKRPTLLTAESGMLASRSINPVTEHLLYLTLFVSNAGGW